MLCCWRGFLRPSVDSHWFAFSYGQMFVLKIFDCGFQNLRRPRVKLNLPSQRDVGNFKAVESLQSPRLRERSGLRLCLTIFFEFLLRAKYCLMLSVVRLFGITFLIAQRNVWILCAENKGQSPSFSVNNGLCYPFPTTHSNG